MEMEMEVENLKVMTYGMEMEYLRSKAPFQPMGIWISDLAPKSFAEVIGNRKICAVLERIIESGQLPNILLSGNHGTGKRTLARLIVQTYLGNELQKGCLAIDGAINRGKDVIASGTKKSESSDQSVLFYANTVVTLRDGKKKIVLIYNFEDMTNEAQNALRRIIETYEYNTRFILICSRLDNVIEAIQSRCVLLATQLLSSEEAAELMTSVRRRNGLSPLDAEIVDIITMLSNGDMKKIINYTQCGGRGSDSSEGATAAIDVFHQIFNIPPIKTLEQMLLDTQDAHRQSHVLEKITYLFDQGYAYSDILEMLSKILAYSDIIADTVRFRYLEILAQYYCAMSQQTHEIHLYALFAEWARLGGGAGSGVIG